MVNVKGWPPPAKEKGFIFDPSLVLYLPLYELDGAKFQSKDAYGHLCAVTDNIWTPGGGSFNGTSSKILITYSTAFVFPNAITVELWLKPIGATGDYGRYVGQNSGWFLGQQIADETNARWEIGGGDILNSGVGRVTVGSFNHIVGTYDKVDKTIYVNGSQVATKKLAVGISTNTNTIDISYDGGTTTRWVQGIFGEVRLYNRALTPAEVQHNYLATKGRYA